MSDRRRHQSRPATVRFPRQRLGRSGHGSVLYDGPPRREELAHHHAWHHSEELAPVEAPVAPVTLLEG